MLPDPARVTRPGRAGHVLLISPLTFSYHEIICAALRDSDYEVTWWNDRASDGALYKIALRLAPRWAKRASASHYQRLLNGLPASTITDLLVIKGEGLSRTVIEALRAKMPDALMGLYLWDGVENVPGVLEAAGLFDSVSTFDPEDAATHGWHFRPLFARDVAKGAGSAGSQPTVSHRFDWCFIGTLHSDRHRVISRLRDATPSGRSFVFGYLPGKLVFALRYLTDRSLWRAPKGSLSIRSMPARDVAAIVSQSGAVLDVEHPRQRGLTMRTIETLLAGKKLLTTNKLIVNSDLFDASRADVIDRNKPAVAASFIAQPFKPVPPEIAATYSCKAWIGEILMYQRQALNRVSRPMTYLLASCAAALVLSLAATGLIRRYALSANMLDYPNARSSHSTPTPRGGGISIVLSFLIVSAAGGIVAHKLPEPLLWALLVSGSAVALLGVIDDRRGVSARWRFLAHAAAACFALWLFKGIPAVPAFGMSLDLGVGGVVVAGLYLVWMVNLYNFMDGIDGLAGIEAITVALGGALTWALAVDTTHWHTAVIFAASATGFLAWNYPPAKIFMGDGGSGFVGMVIGLLSLWAGHEEPRVFWCWFILIGCFMVDATTTLVRRVRRGERFHEAHRSHAYQYASRIFKSHERVSLAIAVINVAWLLPIAVLVARQLLDGVVGVIIAYVPLVLLAFKLKAGDSALQQEQTSNPQ